MGCWTDDEKPKRVVGENAGSLCCTDVLFAILFLANLVPLFILFVDFSNDNDIADHLNSTFGRIAAEEFSDDMALGARAGGYALLGSLALVIVFLTMCYFVPTLLVIVAQLLLITMCVVGGIICMTQAEDLELTDEQGTIVAVVLFVCAALVALYLICIRNRIAFTAQVLKAVAHILMRTPELLIIQAAMSGVVLGFACLWGGAYIELLAVIDEYSYDNDTDAYGAWALGNIYMILSIFWVQFTLLNIALVTTCATVGAWYFSPDTFGNGCFGCKPPVWWGLLRSLTCSFGSIAFGSLILAIMRTIIVVCQYLAKKAEESGGQVAKIACCCFICCLKCLESCLNWLTSTPSSTWPCTGSTSARRAPRSSSCWARAAPRPSYSSRSSRRSCGCPPASASPSAASAAGARTKRWAPRG